MMLNHCQEAESSSHSGVLPHTLVYLSCGWEALRAEIDLLVKASGRREERHSTSSITSNSTVVGSTGSSEPHDDMIHDIDQGGVTSSWRLRHAESFLFFPGTDSIETLCVFSRK